ncbi:MAG: hypothetical protein AAFQ41_09630 [Cyanobacteria bacterium J06623_7]
MRGKWGNIGLWGSIAIVAAAIALAIPTIATGSEIRVDTAQVIGEIEHNLGLGLNFVGDRPDIIQPLQELNLSSLRYATNEYYLFDPQAPAVPKVAIQDPSLWQVKSFAKDDGSWWSKLSFDRFMEICQATNAEPFVVVGIDAIAYRGNAPHATKAEIINAAANWVGYANLTQKYQVKYWEIGNESDIVYHEQIGWTPEAYGETVIQLVQAMKAVDPDIKVGVNGMRIQENDDWWQRLMPIVKDQVDFLVTHQYSWQENYTDWQQANDRYDYNLQDAAEAIANHNPGLTLSVTENSSFNPNITHTNNTWKMLHNFEMLGQSLSTTKVDYIHFWTSRWLEQDPLAEDNSAFDDNYQLTPMGYALKVWNQFLQPQMLATTTAGKGISAWATYSPDARSLNILLVNKQQTPKKTTIAIDNYAPQGRWLQPMVLQGPNPEATAVTWKQSGSALVWGQKIRTKLPPLSVTAISLTSN